MVTSVDSYTEAGGQLSEGQRKLVEKGSVAMLEETIQLGCMSKDCPQRKSTLRENERLGSNYTVKFSKTTLRHARIREKKGPSRRII